MNGHDHATAPEQLTNRAVGRVTDAGWHRIGETHGSPLWQWQEDLTIRVATHDADVLRIFGAILNRRDEMTEREEHEFLTKYLLGGRSGIPSDESIGRVLSPLEHAQR